MGVWIPVSSGGHRWIESHREEALELGVSALPIQYRDIRRAMGFVIQALRCAAPVVRPVSKLPHDLRLW